MLLIQSSYGGALDDGSLLIERLWPGPFNLTLPVMTVPVSADPGRNDKTMLSLYYRWALQSLSALGALHSRGIHLRTFSSQMMWLRSDYSLALTGFVGAEIADDETNYGEGGRVREERSCSRGQPLSAAARVDQGAEQ